MLEMESYPYKFLWLRSNKKIVTIEETEEEMSLNGFLRKYGQYEQCFQGHLKLVQQGYALAQCQVGYFYMEGIGVSKDLGESFAWMKKSAVQGDRDAQFHLAECYEQGMGTASNLEEAKKWYTKSAQQGCKETENRLETLWK